MAKAKKGVPARTDPDNKQVSGSQRKQGKVLSGTPGPKPSTLVVRGTWPDAVKRALSVLPLPAKAKDAT